MARTRARLSLERRRSQGDDVVVPDPPSATERDAPDTVQRPGSEVGSLPDMRWIPGGTFAMGSEDFYPEERPVHRVTVDGFWMDEHAGDQRPSSAASSGRPATSRSPNGRSIRTTTRTPIPSCSCPGSLVFRKTAGPGRPRDYRNWWAYVPGAYWSARRARAATINGRDTPSGRPRRLRGRRGVRGLGGQGAADRGRVGVRRARRARGRRVHLGRRALPRRQGDGEHLAGRVPLAEPEARRLRGHVAGRAASRRTATASTTWPATSGSGRPTGTPAHPDEVDKPCCVPGNPRVARRTRATTPVSRASTIPRKVIKGGSHLCAPNYCLRYRPAARSRRRSTPRWPPRLPLHRARKGAQPRRGRNGLKRRAAFRAERCSRTGGVVPCASGGASLARPTRGGRGTKCCRLRKSGRSLIERWLDRCPRRSLARSCVTGWSSGWWTSSRRAACSNGYSARRSRARAHSNSPTGCSQVKRCNTL